jgi:glucokinase
MDNDVRCAAIGEKYFGAGRHVRNVICITLGTGVGSGIFIDDQLFRGPKDIAGEIGHMTMDPNGPKCNCGNYGCLEAYVGAPNIARRTREAIMAGEPSVVTELVDGDLYRITPKIVTMAALKGDRLARRIMQDTAELIGLALANVVNMFNPELLIIGGGVAQAGDLLLSPIKQTVKSRAMREHAKMVEVVAAELGEDAGVIGAAWLNYLSDAGLMP